MNRKSILLLLFFISSVFSPLYSEFLEHIFTTTSVYDGGSGLSGGSAYTIPSEANSYVGFVWFPYGFTLSDGFNSTFNVIPSIDGTISMNDGTMTLTGDLHLSSGITVADDGKIDGQSNAIFLSDQLSLNTTLTFIGDTIIDGNNNPLILGTDAQLWVSNNTTLTLQNIILKDLSDVINGKIVMEGTGSQLVLDNVIIWLDGDYSFTQGSLFFHNDVTIVGSTHEFSHQSDDPIYIASQTKLFIDHGVQFSYEPASSQELIRMEDKTSHLYLNGSTLYSNAIGLDLKNGTVVFDSLVTLSADGQVVSTAIAFGGVGADDVTSVVLPGTNIKIYGYIDVN